MGCIERGELRAFLDGELRGAELAQVEDHLQRCGSCQSALEGLRDSALVARSALNRLAPAASEVPQSQWSRVRDRATARAGHPVTLDRGLSTMFGSILRFAGGSRVRMAFSTAATVVVVALLFTMTPISTVAGSLLSVFRVQKFVTVQVDPSSMPKMASLTELGSFSTTAGTKPHQASATDAEKAIGFKLPTPGNLPSGIEEKPRALTLTEAYSSTFTPDLKKIKSYLASIGATSVVLPENLNGAPITLQMPAGVMALYLERGAGTRSTEGIPMAEVGQKFVYIGATSSPTLQVPEGLDVEKIRAEVLKIPGLPPELVSQLQAISDWRSTVVVPVVKGTTHEVTVQGQAGVAIAQPDGKGTSLIWPKDGRVYAVSGSFSESELLAAANSLR